MIDDDLDELFICFSCLEKWSGEEAVWIYGVPLCPDCGVGQDSAYWWEDGWEDEDDFI